MASIRTMLAASTIGGDTSNRVAIAPIFDDLANARNPKAKIETLPATMASQTMRAICMDGPKVRSAIPMSTVNPSGTQKIP
jgi:hypothetical protein